jgi:uncharacterized protein (UPF0548 family)
MYLELFRNVDKVMSTQLRLVWALEVGVVAEEVRQLVEIVLERLRRARAKLMDLISRGGPDGLGEVLGDLNKAVGDLEEALKLLRRGP